MEGVHAYDFELIGLGWPIDFEALMIDRTTSYPSPSIQGCKDYCGAHADCTWFIFRIYDNDCVRCRPGTNFILNGQTDHKTYNKVEIVNALLIGTGTPLNWSPY
jgi:hypothetical protein